MFNNKTLLITGGTGSFGKEFSIFILKKYPKIRKIIIFSRDELKQYEIENSLLSIYKKKFRFFLGDIREKDRLIKAFKDVDFIVHAAALKQVPKAEYNPSEYIKTNIIGSQNVIDAAIENNVKITISLSTDKAAAPINLYGATKLCADKLFTSSNNIIGKKKIKFATVRYGNVLGSRGSILPYFLRQSKEEKFFTVTDKRMTRFNITLEQACKMVLWSFQNCQGGEIFVPKIPSFRIVDLANSIDPTKKIKFIGIRPGEKLHEEMITQNDSYNTVDLGKDYYAILNSSDPALLKKYFMKKNVKKVEKNFCYESSRNPKFLSQSQLKKMISRFDK
jgi:UDP-N-acetylglucosamine 4,6-dehydratase (inverting)